MLLQCMALHDRKNSGYAHGGMPLGNFQRCATIMSMYPNIDHGTPQATLIGMVIKHIDRVLWDMNRQLPISSDSLQDIVVYFTILACMERDTQPAAVPKNVR